ncbi:MAG: NAD(P)/FAD-dependent oxidoreductase [Thermoanaerobaculia bacterium]
MRETEEEILDVAIVGGGVSGLYSAWRLLCDAVAHGRKLRVIVFEGSKRIGGRLVSLKPPGMQTHCELGGMRFMSRHRLVRGLVQQFELATEPMPTDEPGNIAYLRGRQLRLADLSKPDAVPYNLSEVEKKHVLADTLLTFALRQIVPDCTKIDYEGLLYEMRTAEFDHKPLHELGLWNVLARVLSPDAYAFVRDSGGYDCLVSNWNAADAIPFILADFGVGATYRRIVDGYEQLPQLLRREFERAGGEVRLDTCLKSFDVEFDVEEARDVVVLKEEARDVVVLKFYDGSVVRARQLVLAMPRRSLEMLAPSGQVLDPHADGVRALIESVEPIPMFKIFLCYPYPWWKAADVSTGRSVTDMPVRQCYYWSTEPNANSSILASYDDELSVTFWAGLRDPKAIGKLWEPRKPYMGMHPASENWKTYRASHAMVEEAHRQLVQMHGVSYAPEPYDAAYRDWAEDPYGGGVNFWRIHERSWEVMPRMVNPVPGLPVYVCGEAYSQEQGWVEGALQTAEIMLTQHFGLPPRA